jgi:DNA invertase Pin-like site-specific DNA recombinase
MATNSGKLVCYYRVSTGRQGKSGLGLEAQRAAVATYLNGGDWSIVAEFTESNPVSGRTGRRWIRRWPRRGCTVRRSSSARSIG